jgi:hypothetical protein
VALLGRIASTLEGLVPGDAIVPIPPTLEDVFVLHGETQTEVAA